MNQAVAILNDKKESKKQDAQGQSRKAKAGPVNSGTNLKRSNPKRKPKTPTPKQSKTQFKVSMEFKSNALHIQKLGFLENCWQTVGSPMIIDTNGIRVKGKFQDFMNAYTQYVAQVAMNVPSAFFRDNAEPSSKYYKRLMELATSYEEEKSSKQGANAKGSAVQKSTSEVSTEANGETPSS